MARNRDRTGDTVADETQEQDMTDTETTTDETVGDAELDAEAAPTEGETAPAEAASTAGKRVPPPDGFTTPVQVAKLLGPVDADGNVITNAEGKAPGIRPQIVYGYIRNSKTFPFHAHPETGSPIVKVDEVLTWWKEKEQRKAGRAAAKAAEASGESAPTAEEPASDLT
jgi:hypothetical protein